MYLIEYRERGGKKQNLSTLLGANGPEDNIWDGEDDDKNKTRKTNKKKQPPVEGLLKW